REQMRSAPLLTDLAPGYAGNAVSGRLLFSEKGCLACHSHAATEADQGKVGDDTFAPAIHGEAIFGPNLSQLVDKLVAKAQGDEKDIEPARKWLIQWIMDPHVHSPRSRMPITHLTNKDAADVAAWLLAQPAADEGAEWKGLAVREPSDKN